MHFIILLFTYICLLQHHFHPLQFCSPKFQYRQKSSYYKGYILSNTGEARENESSAFVYRSPSRLSAVLDSTQSSLDSSQLCSWRPSLVLFLQHLIPFSSMQMVLSQISLKNKDTLKRTVHGKFIHTRSRPLGSSLFPWMESPVSLVTQFCSPAIDAITSHLLKGFTPAVRCPFSSIIFSSMELLL